MSFDHDSLPSTQPARSLSMQKKPSAAPAAPFRASSAPKHGAVVALALAAARQLVRYPGHPTMTKTNTIAVAIIRVTLTRAHSTPYMIFHRRKTTLPSPPSPKK